MVVFLRQLVELGKLQHLRVLAGAMGLEFGLGDYPSRDLMDFTFGEALNKESVHLPG